MASDMTPNQALRRLETLTRELPMAKIVDIDECLAVLWDLVLLGKQAP
jgi:hypothetical protein